MDHLKKQKNFDIIITEKRKEVNNMSKNYSDAEGCAIVIVGDPSGTYLFWYAMGLYYGLEAYRCGIQSPGVWILGLVLDVFADSLAIQEQFRCQCNAK